MALPRKGPLTPLEESLEYLYALRRFGMKLDLKTPRRLLRRLGSPDRGLRALHIAGTNGKGSTAAIAEAILRRAGRRTGLYTSPHLVDFAERVRIDGRPIGRRDLARLVARVRPAVEEISRLDRRVTFFEATTALALLHFAEQKVDVAVIETGLGGRLDATNLVEPLVCAITPIALEHQKQLGRTLGAIAWEKAGILKKDVPAVSAPQPRPARAVLVARARALGIPLAILGRDFEVRSWPNGGFDYEGLGLSLEAVRCGLPGPHQVQNAAVALAACERLAERGLRIPVIAMRRGVESARCPGRLEVVQRGASGRPRVVLDGAHNPAAARALARALRATFTYRRLVLVFGAMADKDHRALVRPLAREVARTGGLVVCTAPAFERSADPRSIGAILRAMGVRTEVVPSVPAALDHAMNEAAPGDIVVVAGSLYLVGEARAHLVAPGARRSVLPGPV
jgi:dihydrofolate synthase/folylpolyglutamate synthase